MADDLTHKPIVLYRASLERMEAAWFLRRNHATSAAYFGGLAIECLLQAIALRAGAEHDAGHDLGRWLAKCSTDLQDLLKATPARVHWARVVVEWGNWLRYVDQNTLLGWARKQPRWRRLQGDDEERLLQFMREFLDSADDVFKKGIRVWQQGIK